MYRIPPTVKFMSKTCFPSLQTTRGPCKKPEWCLSTFFRKPMTTSMYYLLLINFSLCKFIRISPSSGVFNDDHSVDPASAEIPSGFENRVAPSLRVATSKHIGGMINAWLAPWRGGLWRFRVPPWMVQFPRKWTSTSRPFYPVVSRSPSAS